MNKVPKVNRVHLFGDRVLVKNIEETVSGNLVVPQTRHRAYEIGEVVSLGDCRAWSGDSITETTPLVKIGDYVWFQLNPQVAFGLNTVRLEGVTYLALMQHDLLAHLTKPTVTIDNFQILGYWLLLTLVEEARPDSVIALPDSVERLDVRNYRYTVAQRGVKATNVEVGDEVLIETSRATPVQIGDQKFMYIDSRHILGKIGKAAKIAKLEILPQDQ